MRLVGSQHEPEFEPDTFFAEHREELIRFARRKLGAAEDAEDIVQDLYIPFAGWWERQRQMGRQVGNPRALALRCLQRKLCDFYRRRRATVPLEKARQPITAGGRTLYWTPPPPDAELANRETVDSLETTLETLDEQELMAVEGLAEGRSQAEIAEQMQASQPTVSRRAKSGRAKLAELIEELEYDVYQDAPLVDPYYSSVA